MEQEIEAQLFINFFQIFEHEIKVVFDDHFFFIYFQSFDDQISLIVLEFGEVIIQYGSSNISRMIATDQEVLWK